MKVFTLIICFWMFSVSQMRGQTLREAVIRMMEFEPELNAVEYDTLSSKEDQKIARSGLMPQVGMDGSSGYSQRDRTTDGLVRSGDTLLSRQLGVSVRQLLYDGGTTHNQAKASRNAFLSQQYLEKSQIEMRVVDLAEVYMELIRADRQIALAEQNVENHRRMRDMLQERANAGGSRADVALVHGRLGLATNSLATQKLSKRSAEARFRRLTGNLPGEITNPGLPKIGNSISDIDISNNFNYLAAAEALEAAQHRAKATNGINAPKIYFDAGVTRGEDSIGVSGQDNESRALITGSWELFKGGYNEAQKKREHYQVGKFEELLRAAELEREYQLENAWNEREGSFSSIDALTKYSTELSSVVDDYSEQFRVGRQELLNILDVQSEFYNASSQLLDARFDQETNSYRIAGIQGRATMFVLGKEGYEKCFGGKENYIATPVDQVPFNVDPDNRVPVTQTDLMKGRFDTDGPAADHEDLHNKYYVEREQLPIVPVANARPKGKFFGLFNRSEPASSTLPIFK
ncbi:MAG: TolC family protein [Verrucomicrobiales bacterium]|nr:TolC family protein [Verrucomicrobiales bacterium]